MFEYVAYSASHRVGYTPLTTRNFVEYKALFIFIVNELLPSAVWSKFLQNKIYISCFVGAPDQVGPMTPHC